MEQFDAEFVNLRISLKDLQGKLDKFVEAGEEVVAQKSLPVKFFNRVNVGRLTELFSELTTMIYKYEEGFKKALEKVDSSES